jgi:hypothetical protein
MSGRRVRRARSGLNRRRNTYNDLPAEKQRARKFPGSLSGRK